MKLHNLNPVKIIKSAFGRYRGNFVQLSYTELSACGPTKPKPGSGIDLKLFHQYVVRYVDSKAKRSGIKLTAFWANFKVAPKMGIEITLEVLYRGLCTEYGEEKANTWLNRLVSGFLGSQQQAEFALSGT